jgi:hypothetical protein
MSTAEKNVLEQPDGIETLDYELREFLEAEGLTDRLDELDRVQTDVFIDRRLQVIASLQQQINHNNEVAARRMQMIRDAADDQNAGLKRRVDYLMRELETVARGYPYPKGSKTRKLPFGEIALRSVPAKLVVDDPAPLLELVESEMMPEELRRTKVTVELDKNELNKWWQSTGAEEIPGCHIEPAHEKAVVKVKVEA